MHTVDYSLHMLRHSGVCVSVVYALVTRLSEPCKNRLNRLRIRDAMPFGTRQTLGDLDTWVCVLSVYKWAPRGEYN